MNVTVVRADLVRELTLSEKAVPRKPTIASLNGAMMVAADGGLTISTTNLELGLVTRCKATVAAPGRQVAPAVKLLEILRSMSVPDVQLAADGAAMVVTGGGFKAKLQTWPVDDFPVLPAPAGPGEPLPGGLLKRLIVRTRFAVTDDDKRFYLAGGHLEVGEATLRLVTTDGKRLAKAEGARGTGAALEAALLPRRTLDTLVAMLEEDDEVPVGFSRSENHLFFAVGDRLLVSKQIEAQFPAYEKIIPTSSSVRVTVGRQALTDALRRATMLADMDGRKATLSSDSLGLTISAARTDVGSGDEALSEATHEGPELSIGVNANHLLDFLEVVDTGRVVLSGTTPDRALVLSPADGDIAYTYVVSPMR